MKKKRRTKNEILKRIVGMLLVFVMVLSGLPIVGNNSVTDVYAEEVTSTEFSWEDCANGEVYYTLSGGVNDWNPLNKDNQMAETIWDGVYSIKIDIPAYDAATEWQNRFKICKIDEVTVEGGGWTGSICLGTTVAYDNQTMFRAQNEEEITDAIVYFDSNNGAVVILEDGVEVDYYFSWVGYETEFQYTTVSEFATCGYKWPEDKIMVDELPDIKKVNNELLAKVCGQDLANESLYKDGNVKYVVAGGCSPYAWGTASSLNEMKVDAWEGVYSFEMSVPAYNEEAEWNNRFKILRLDDITYANGWLGSLCLGTSVYNDNQTTFRIENEEAMVVTIYLDTNTGAVYIKNNSDDSKVDYKFSWVGYDSEVQYTTVSGFATCGYTWPEAYVHTDVPKDLVNNQNSLIAKVNGTDLSDESLYTDGTVKYTLAGGCSPYPWGTSASANEMIETNIEGVYSIKLSVKEFDESAEWNNRFKICRLDDLTCSNGWMGSICLGTTIADDNQTIFRIENSNAMDITVYFDSNTGAVVILDSDRKEIDYKFSWVGYDSEVQYTTVSEFATCGYTWPEDKIKVDTVPDIAEGYEDLVEKIMNFGKVTYHFYNANGWDNVGAWVRQGIDWSENALPLDKCVLKDTTDGSVQSEPLWPGAKMEEEGGGWYKITCSYSAPEKGSMMIFNNYVGNATASDTISEADIQKLIAAGIKLDDQFEKKQTQNIMIKKNNLTSKEYWIIWDGDSSAAQIVLGKSDMITDVEPDSYKKALGKEEEKVLRLTVGGSASDYTKCIGDYAVISTILIDDENDYTYKFLMEDVETGEIKVLKNYSNSDMCIYLFSEIGSKKFTAYAKDSDGNILKSNTVIISVVDLSATLKVNYEMNDVTVLKGEYVLIESRATGGTGTYFYKFVAEDIETSEIKVLQDYGYDSNCIMKFDSAGTKIIKAYVKDSSETEIVTNTITIEVEEGLSAILKVNDSTKKIITKEGDSLILKAEANGGEGEYIYRFEELNLDTEEYSILNDFSETSEYIYQTKSAGNYYLIVAVEDSAGNLAEAIVQLSTYDVGWRQVDNNIYYLDDDGIEVIGWNKIDGNWYYFNNYGVMQTSRWVDNKYYVKSNGIMATSEIIDGKYYVDANGVWQKTTGWKQVGENWYYFVNGVMQTSRWVGSKYYVKADGTMATSEFVDNGNYYVNEDGVWVSTTRWLQIDGSWYYLKAGTVQKSKWVKVGTDYYYFDASGVMQTSRWINNKYYVKENGKMAVSEWVDGDKYYVGEDGVWVQGA